MARKRIKSRPRLITLRGLLFVHVAIYIGAILYVWWNFVELMYATGFIFNQADVPLPLHIAWTGALAGHIALTSLLSLLNRFRRARKSRRETGALSKLQSDEERFKALLAELTDLRASMESRRGSTAPYRLIEWEDEPKDELISLEQYRAEREALDR